MDEFDGSFGDVGTRIGDGVIELGFMHGSKVLIANLSADYARGVAADLLELADELDARNGRGKN